tara:strand:+ start:733 stop:2154 length:1422 start_codon:yes stop_codon:yes gene_type:complete
MTENVEKTDSLSSRAIINLECSNDYRNEVHQVIPGGAHTYSKGDDQFPLNAPAAIVRGKGARVWDLDGNEYVDCGLGLGAVGLGHAYEPVLEAVRAQLELGAAFSRPASIELEFGEEFVELIPGAERVKFAKNGSAVTTAAVKLARAYTGRDLIAFPASQPFFSYDDWFIGKTKCNSGVPEDISNLSLHYDSSSPGTLQELFDEFPNQIAGVITEAEEAVPLPPGKINEVANIARRGGALFILDEMGTGYRAGWPGAGVVHGIDPDMATWGKTIANGFSFCALTGKADVMDLGGIKQTTAPRVFLISTTHGGETHAIAAARAVLNEYRQNDVVQYKNGVVSEIAAGMKAAVKIHGLESTLKVHAVSFRVACACYDAAGNISAAMRTLLLQEMISRGVLFQGFFLPCFSHGSSEIEHIVNAFGEVCAIYRRALEDGGPEAFLKSKLIPPVFRKYNNCSMVCPSIPCPYEETCHD